VYLPAGVGAGRGLVEDEWVIGWVLRNGYDEVFIVKWRGSGDGDRGNAAEAEEGDACSSTAKQSCVRCSLRGGGLFIYFWTQVRTPPFLPRFVAADVAR
jgi:hypothetical protein